MSASLTPPLFSLASVRIETLGIQPVRAMRGVSVVARETLRPYFVVMAGIAPRDAPAHCLRLSEALLATGFFHQTPEVLWDGELPTGGVRFSIEGRVFKPELLHDASLMPPAPPALRNVVARALEERVVACVVEVLDSDPGTRVLRAPFFDFMDFPLPAISSMGLWKDDAPEVPLVISTTQNFTSAKDFPAMEMKAFLESLQLRDATGANASRSSSDAVSAPRRL